MSIDLDMVQSFLDPKMMIVIVALWVLGSLFKVSPIVSDKWIVWILTLISLTTAFFIFGLNDKAIMQGIIAVGVSVYGHQIVKQSSK
jgi:hypothetical protein